MPYSFRCVATCQAPFGACDKDIEDTCPPGLDPVILDMVRVSPVLQCLSALIDQGCEPVSEVLCLD